MQRDKEVGNILIGQSGGPTAVINASLAGLLSALHRAGFKGRMLGMAGGLEKFLAGREPVGLTDLSQAELALLRATPGAALGSCRINLGEEDYGKLLELFKRYRVRYLAFIGGNGSMRTPLEMDRVARDSGYELYCIGIPKTIDNDLAGTDHAPGYGSAARWLAHATLDCGLDLYTMRGYDEFKVFEVMGRDSGWLAASTLLARSRQQNPPHFVLVPERPLDEAAFLAQVQEVYRREGCVLVVAAEGLRNTEGKPLMELQAGENLRRDAIGRPILSLGEGVAGYLCNLVGRELGLKTRYDKPGTLQRGAMNASPVDRDEAFRLGEAAAEYFLAEKSGFMAGLKRVSNDPYECEIVPVPLKEVVGVEKTLPDEFFNGNGLDEAKVRAYVAPLIGPALPEPFRFQLER